jgi:4-hydroxy-tetrahydrodipicolinate synthase
MAATVSQSFAVPFGMTVAQGPDAGAAAPEPERRAVNVSAPTSAKALAREKVKGLWIAIPTPFTADGRQVDEDALAASVEHYIAGLRVDGIFCGGVMGEFWALSLDERKRVHELVARQAAGRVPVMAHVGHHVFSDMLELCEHATASGIEFGIAINPYYPPSPAPESVRAWYEELAEASSLPMFLFNTTYAGYTLSPELIAELAELDNICGIKNPQSSEHLLRVHELAGHRIVVTDASERHWLALHTEHGFQALMSTPALALYQRPGHLPVLEYTRMADSGDLEGARALSGTLGPSRDSFDRWMREPWLEHRVIPIAQLKAWLGMLGLPQGPVRPPLVALTREENAALRRDLEAAGVV